MDKFEKVGKNVTLKESDNDTLVISVSKDFYDSEAYKKLLKYKDGFCEQAEVLAILLEDIISECPVTILNPLEFGFDVDNMVIGLDVSIVDGAVVETDDSRYYLFFHVDELDPLIELEESKTVAYTLAE